MVKNKSDKRYRRSDKKIINALVKLLDRKSVISLKIVEICRVARISKTTFYTHFDNLEGMFLSIDDRIVRRYRSSFRAYHFVSVGSFARFFLMFILKNKVFFNSELKINNVRTLKKIIELSKPEVRKFWNNYGDDLDDKIYRFFTYEVIGLIEIWAIDDNFDENNFSHYEISLERLIRGSSQKIIGVLK